LRLFATGAVSWVMDARCRRSAHRSQMVSKAIERAQNTVEGKNARSARTPEVRRGLKRAAQGHLRTRQQVIEGEDIHDATIVLIEEILTNVVDERLEGEFPRRGSSQLVIELTNYYPTALSAGRFRVPDAMIFGPRHRRGVGQYEKKCEEYRRHGDARRSSATSCSDPRPALARSPLGHGLLRDGIHFVRLPTGPVDGLAEGGYLMFEPPGQRRR